MILWGTSELEDGAVCSPVFVFIGGGEHIAAQAYTSVWFVFIGGGEHKRRGPTPPFGFLVRENLVLAWVLICSADRGGVKYPYE